MGRKKLKSTFSSLGRDGDGISVEDMDKNPLHIPEIVAIVVGNIVKVEDLKIIRALSKQWRDESRKKWRNSAVFVITKESKLVLAEAFDTSAFIDFGIEEQEKVQAEMDPFLLRDNPFRNYRFQGDLAMKSDFELDLIFNKVIAPHARYLDLGEFVLSEREGFDLLERIFRYNLSITELALTPLRKDDDYFARGGTFDQEVYRRERMGSSQPPPKVPTVLHLTLLAPTPERHTELLKEKALKPLFVTKCTSIYNEFSYQNTVRWFILKRMPNLKGIRVSSGIAMEDILKEMRDATSRGEVIPQLEEIDISFYRNSDRLLGPLLNYIRVVRPPLRKIKAIARWENCTERPHCFLRVLRFVEETLIDLELEVDCKRERSMAYTDIPAMATPAFFLNGRNFPNLTRFKVVMDYPDGAKGKLLSFDLNHLRKMPKLKEFFFGFKNPAEYIPERVISSKLEIPEESPSWVNKVTRYAFETHGIPEGIHFDPVLGEEVEGDGLKRPDWYIPSWVPSTKLEISENPTSWVNKVVPYSPETFGIPEGIYFDPVLGKEVEGDGMKHLKSFHLHGNLTKAALQLLGKWTKNLQTLEGIFDEENFSTVRETWPRLQTLKLLQGSNVPERLLVSESTNELSVVRLDLNAMITAIRKGSLRKRKD